jgi:hypothetical protein
MDEARRKGRLMRSAILPALSVTHSAKGQRVMPD